MTMKFFLLSEFPIENRDSMSKYIGAYFGLHDRNLLVEALASDTKWTKKLSDYLESEIDQIHSPQFRAGLIKLLDNEEIKELKKTYTGNAFQEIIHDTFKKILSRFMESHPNTWITMVKTKHDIDTTALSGDTASNQYIISYEGD